MKGPYQGKPGLCVASWALALTAAGVCGQRVSRPVPDSFDGIALIAMGVMWIGFGQGWAFSIGLLPREHQERLLFIRLYPRWDPLLKLFCRSRPITAGDVVRYVQASFGLGAACLGLAEIVVGILWQLGHI